MQPNLDREFLKAVADYVALSSEIIEELVKGDASGHAFHGNRFTGGIGGFVRSEMNAKQRAMAEEWMKNSPQLKRAGLPAQTPAKMKAKLEDVFSRAQARGLVGKNWYAQCNGSLPQHVPQGSFTRPDGKAISASCKGIADANGVDVKQAAAVVAALSPQTEWQHDYVDRARPSSFPNIEQADRVLAITRANPEVTVTAADIEKLGRTPATKGLDIKPGTYRANEMDARALSVVVPGLRGPSGTYQAGAAIELARGGSPDEFLTSPKVRTFCNNLSYPEAEDGATIDGRMLMGATKIPETEDEGKALALWFKGGGMYGTAVYRTLNDAIHEAAKDHGVLPHEYQAIVWKQLEAEGTGTVYQMAESSAAEVLGRSSYRPTRRVAA